MNDGGVDAPAENSKYRNDEYDLNGLVQEILCPHQRPHHVRSSAVNSSPLGPMPGNVLLRGTQPSPSNVDGRRCLAALSICSAGSLNFPRSIAAAALRAVDEHPFLSPYQE